MNIYKYIGQPILVTANRCWHGKPLKSDFYLFSYRWEIGSQAPKVQRNHLESEIIFHNSIFRMTEMGFQAPEVHRNPLKSEIRLVCI